MSANVGDVLEGRYRLDELLGRGGFGAVFRARDLGADRDVAVKLTTVAEPRDRARFRREIELIAGLRDPHTVTMFSYGELPDGSLYSVLELVPGADLSEVMEERGPMPPDLVVHIARQVLASLREAHRAGIVHRDVKPENIRIFSYDDDPYCVKLLDFGIARRPASDDRVTKTGALVGTPRYMAPEQLLSEPFTPASDLYSLGLVMLEMLIGRKTMHGTSFGDQLERLRTGHLLAVPHTSSVPGLPAVIARMTARSPDDRYASAEAVLTALERAHEPRPEPSRPPVSAETHSAAPDPRGPRPHRPELPTRPEERAFPVRAVLAAAAVCVVVALVLLVRPESSTPPPVPPAPTQAVTTPSPRPAAAAATPESEDGCGADGNIAPGVYYDSAIIGLGEYAYIRYVPESYDAGAEHPLVVLLARAAMDAEQFLDESGFRELADEEGFVLVVPSPKLTRTTLDLAARDGLLHAMVKHAARKVCVDSDRIFAVGNGSGGHAARRLSCQPWIAAAAEASARPRDAISCERRAPYALLSPIRSPREPLEGGTVDCSGSNDLLSLAEHEGAFLTRHGCNGEPKLRIRKGDSNCQEWTCEVAPFMHCRIDGGQAWPGQQPRNKCDGEPSDFPAARVVWEFFERAVPPRQ